MITKPVIPNQQAQDDIDEAIAYCAREFGKKAAFGFIDALEDAYTVIGRHPEAGSTRYAEAFTLPGLRNWSMRTHPMILFYIEMDDHISLWRVLHAQKDIGESLRTTSTA